MLNRRQWFKTTAGLLLAPAVVQSSSIMPIRSGIVQVTDIHLAEILQAMMNSPHIREQLVSAVMKTNPLAAWALAFDKIEITPNAV
jgi:hypothetical protein